MEWIGEIPEHWKVLKSKYFHSNLKLLNTKRICNNVLSLTLRGVVNNDLDSPEGLVPKDYATYQLFEKDDLVFKLIDLENISTSRVGIVHEQGIMSSAYIRMQVGKGSVPKFAYYYYYSLYLNQVYNNIGSGVRSTLGPNDLFNIEYIEPSIAEQTAIASFLDDKTAQIDQAIRQKEKMIELLKERRQIVINDAVTKGLDPNAPMKESGVEWIGEIPEHWETKKLKYAVNKIGDIDHYMPNSVANGKPYLMTGDIFEQASQIDFFNCKQISEKDFTRLSKKIKPTMGDLIFARYATIGTACYVDIEKDFLVSYSCVTIKPNQRKIIGKYLFYFLKSNVFAEEVKRYINSNTQGNVGIESLHRIRLVVPPLFEQSQIVAFIDEQTTKIDRAIDLQQTYIDKLKEYKATLIDSVVTGKVRVIA